MREGEPVQYDDEEQQFVMLPSDMALLSDSQFMKHVQRYARSQDTWFVGVTSPLRLISQVPRF